MIRSHRPLQKSDCEQIALATLYKRVTGVILSVFESVSHFHSQKTMFLTVFHCFSPFSARGRFAPPSLFAPSLIFKEQRERFAHRRAL